MSSNKKLILIIFLAIALRFLALLKYGDFWDDEIFSFIYSQKPWPQGLIYWLWETNPPLHLFILKIWFFIFPASEFFARLPSLLAGVSSVYCAYLLGKYIFNKNAGLLSAFYLAVHPYAIFWSATARTYSFLILLSLLSTLILYRRFILNENSKALRVAGPIVNFALIFSHLSALFIFAGQAFALLLLKGKNPAECPRTSTGHAGFWDWLRSNLPIFLPGFFWIAASFYIKMGNNIGQAWFLNMEHSSKSFINPLINLFLGQYSLIPGLILVLIFCFLIFKILKKEKSKELFFLIIIILTPITLAFGFGVWHIKFFIGILPLLAVALSYALTKYFRPAFVPTESGLRQGKPGFAYVIIFSICLVGIFNLWKSLPLTDWSKCDLMLSADYTSLPSSQEGDRGSVLIYNNYILKTQIDRYLPDVSNALPLIIYQDMNWDDMVVKKNYIFTKLTDAQKDDWYESNKINSYSKAVLLQGEYGYMTKLDDLLAKHGWILESPPRSAPIMGDYKIYLYAPLEIGVEKNL